MFAKNSTPKAGERAKAPEAPQVEQPAFWPLIRQVAVRCNAKALSTGAILVDLPGTADANAARNSIAKEYMKKWVLSPPSPRCHHTLIARQVSMHLDLGADHSCW
jgi:hypothetical protein